MRELQKIIQFNLIVIGKSIISCCSIFSVGGKLKTIRETTSDALEVVRVMATPEFRDSLEKVRETTAQSKEIISLLQTPGIEQNIANIRHTAESFQSATSSLESIVREFKGMGLGKDFENASKLVKDAIETARMLQTNKQAVTELNATLRSLGELFDEMKLAIKGSRKSGIIRDLSDAADDVTENYQVGRGGILITTRARIDDIVVLMDAVVILSKYLPLILVFFASLSLLLAAAAFVEGNLLIGSIDLLLGIGNIALLTKQPRMTVYASKSINIQKIGKNVRYCRTDSS